MRVGIFAHQCPWRLVCGAEKRRNTSDQGFLTSGKTAPFFPLRRWRCGRCNHTNEPQHLFYCSKCGSVQPEMVEALTHTSFDCRVCSHHNPLGLLRPWCPACGTLSTVAAAGRQRPCGDVLSAAHSLHGFSHIVMAAVGRNRAPTLRLTRHGLRAFA
ncbi:hypothetical protein C3747_181g2 [Trypanosoma cruzi]|uniref:RanBP2-type domain-containing protein n=1 Tax=Trypanosoma cruzi TaxID=5693 RepID=A0A2V2W2Z8_TRYCR|nr:hypothetical protein C3747_181g2 [Trypanosoma cruzi]